MMSERNGSDLILDLDSKPNLVRVHSKVVQLKGSLMWKIRGFSLCDDYLESPDFTIGGLEKKFYLWFYPQGYEEENKGFISVYLFSYSEDIVSVTLSISFVDIRGSNDYFLSDFFKANSTEGCGWDKFCSREELHKEYCYLLPNDELSISCVVTMSVEKSHKALFSSNSNSLIKSLSSLRRKELKEFTDVVLMNKEMEFPAHKVLLVARSSVFESMLKEIGNDASVLVLVMDTEVLEELLNFIYTDNCHFRNVDFCLKLLSAADRYAVPGLQAACTNYLRENMSEKNVVDIVLIADSLGKKGLYSTSIDYICDELPSVTFHSTWKQKLITSPKILQDIIQRVHTKRNDEKCVNLI